MSIIALPFKTAAAAAAAECSHGVPIIGSNPYVHRTASKLNMPGP